MSTNTGSDGLAWFPVALTNGANALLNFRAWWDAGSGTSAFDEYQDAWATAQWAQNAAVWVKASPDVANDKTQSIARGQFHFYRTGSAAQLAAQQLVNFTLPVTPTNQFPSPATYGSTGNGDYTLVTNSANWPAAWTVGSGTGTLTFAANQTEAVLDVLPRADTKLETNVVYLTVTAGTGYAVPAAGNILTPPSATVLLYDGPEYTLYELGDFTPTVGAYTAMGPYRPAAHATQAFGLDNNATPKIAGGATYLNDSYGQPALFGGWWTSAATTQLRDYYNDRVVYWAGWGAPTLGVSDDGIFVGQKSTNAFKFTTAAFNAVNLPHLTPNSANSVSAAYGINPVGELGGVSGRYIVGTSRNTNGIDRPVVWWGGTNVPIDLGAGTGSLVATGGAGETTAANNEAQLVGWAEVAVGGLNVRRAFRSKPNFDGQAIPLVIGDELPPLTSDTNTLNNNRAAAWAVDSDAGIAVGGSVVKQGAFIYTTNAVFWAARIGTNANPLASKLAILGAPKNGSSLIPVAGEAKVSGSDDT